MSILDHFTHTLMALPPSGLGRRLAPPVYALILAKSYYSTARRPGHARLGITGTGADWRLIGTLMIAVALLGGLSSINFIFNSGAC